MEPDHLAVTAETIRAQKQAAAKAAREQAARAIDHGKARRGVITSMTGTEDAAETTGDTLGSGPGATRWSNAGSGRATLSMTLPVVTAIAGGTGVLDPAIVRRVVKRDLPKLQACYAPALAGQAVTRFTISEQGKVSHAAASGVDPAVARCLVKVIEALELPRPEGTGGVAVTVTFTLP